MLYRTRSFDPTICALSSVWLGATINSKRWEMANRESEPDPKIGEDGHCALFSRLLAFDSSTNLFQSKWFLSFHYPERERGDSP